MSTRPFFCAECGTTEATTWVVTILDPDDPDTQTEVCRACDDIVRPEVVQMPGPYVPGSHGETNGRGHMVWTKSQRKEE